MKFIFATQSLIYGLLLSVALTHSACQPKPAAETNPNPDKPTALATIGMVADLVRAVGGDDVAITTLIGEGIDPHLYNPTLADVKALDAADIIFYNGLMLEGKMEEVLSKQSSDGKPVHAIAEAVKNRQNFLLEDEEGHTDPHVWMDVKAWTMALDEVTAALTAFLPQKKEAFTVRANAYKEKLTELDAYAQKTISSIPEESRFLITAHDAFGYLAQAYGIEVKGIQGISTESEAAIRDIEELVTFIVDQKIPAIFVESSLSDKNVKALIEGAQAKGQQVLIGGELFSDAMGPAGTYEGSYIGMIDHNVTTITNALGGQAPATGLNGNLTVHE